MTPVPHASYQIGIALDHDRVAVLAEADGFALAQAKQIVLAQLLREGAWPVVVVIARLDDGAVLDWQLVTGALDA
jgi:hypothetical protein